MFLFMEVTVYSVNVCHQTYWLLPLPVLASHCRTQSHPAGILCGATECRSLSLHWPLMLYVLYSLPTQLTSCSAAVSCGKGCVVLHTQVTSVDLWGWAFLPVQERQEQLQLHCQSGDTELPLGLWCWGCAGSTEHRQVKDTLPCWEWLCTCSWWGWHQRRDSLAALDTLISSGTPWTRLLWVQSSEGRITVGRFMSWCSETMPYIWTWEKRSRSQVVKSMMLCLWCLS